MGLPSVTRREPFYYHAHQPEDDMADKDPIEPQLQKMSDWDNDLLVKEIQIKAYTRGYLGEDEKFSDSPVSKEIKRRLDRLQRVEEENQKLRDALWKTKPYIILYLRDRANPETVGEAQAQERIKEIDTLLADLESDS